MNKKLHFVALAAGLLVFNSSHAYEELGKIKTDLATMPVPTLLEVGQKKIGIRNGEEAIYTVTSIDDETTSVETGNGCTFTDPIFPNSLITLTPSQSWKNCSGSSGHATVIIKGELFPLAKGNKVVFNVKGETTEGSWTGTWNSRRVCKVKGTYRVKTVSGEHDTWKIVCKEKNQKRTVYYSPELELAVAVERKHYNNRERNFIYEHVRIE